MKTVVDSQHTQEYHPGIHYRNRPSLGDEPPGSRPEIALTA
jgi:hypothetical protein